MPQNILSSSNLKRITLGILLLIATIAVYRIWIAGRVTIITPSETATVSFVDHNNQLQVAGTGKKVTIRAPKGAYTAVVTDNERESWKPFSVPKFFAGQDVFVDLSNVQQAQQLYPLFVQTIVKKGKSIRYLPRSGTSIIEQNLATNIQRNLTLNSELIREIQWIDYSKAILVDELGKLVWFEDGKLTKLRGLSSTLKFGTAYSANSKGQLAVIDDSALYYFSSPSSAPLKLAEDIGGAASLRMNEKGEILYFSLDDTGGDAPELGESKEPLPTPTPQLVRIYYPQSRDYSEIKLDLSGGPLVDAEWSSESNAFSYVAGNSIHIYEIDSTKNLLVITSSPDLIHRLLWKGRNPYFHIANELWRYDPENMSIQRVSRPVDGIAASASMSISNGEAVFSVRDPEFARGLIYTVDLTDTPQE